MELQPNPQSGATTAMDDRRHSFKYEDLLACGRGELFGPGNAQLPLPPMLMFDRITDIQETGGEHGKGMIRAELDVKPDLWFFLCHFKGDPVMPGCLGLDALWQMVGFFLGWLGAPGKGRALGLGEVKFSGQVLPTVKKVVYGVDFKRVMRSKLVLGIADGWLSADGDGDLQGLRLEGRSVQAGRGAAAERRLRPTKGAATAGRSPGADRGLRAGPARAIYGDGPMISGPVISGPRSSGSTIPGQMTIHCAS